MVISKDNFTSNLEETVFNKMREILGTTYTHNTLGTRTLTYSGAYPEYEEGAKVKLPIIVYERDSKGRPVQFEQGGKRKYADTFNINILAGGYDDETANAFMKNQLMDKLLFGFDLKWFDFINYDTGLPEGKYYTEAREVYRIPTGGNSIYDRNRAQVMITTWVTI
ncbi:MAG: hypothetical protein PHN69_04145 [Candidatus Pacebacteria bacterium]|nr:hypothetical protein [Candidatus Paceibacterota bacterium]